MFSIAFFFFFSPAIFCYVSSGSKGSIKCLKTRFVMSLTIHHSESKSSLPPWFSPDSNLLPNKRNYSSVQSRFPQSKVRGLFSPVLAIQWQIPAMSCWVQQAQPETHPELARRCQKELLLNVRGFASTQKRDFDAFVEWISLPAHQILSVNRTPPPRSPPTHTPPVVQWWSALRPTETRVQLWHDCQAEIKLPTTELTVTHVTWETVPDMEKKTQNKEEIRYI